MQDISISENKKQFVVSADGVEIEIIPIYKYSPFSNTVREGLYRVDFEGKTVDALLPLEEAKSVAIKKLERELKLKL